MAQNIANKLGSYESNQYYDPKFHTILKDHLLKIQKSIGTQPMVIDPNVAFHGKGDLYLVFKQMSLPPKYWWITMVLNNISSPEQYDGERTSFLLPDQEYIDDLFRLYNTVDGII